MRLVGDDGIITLPKINELKEIQDNKVEQIDIGIRKTIIINSNHSDMKN